MIIKVYRPRGWATILVDVITRNKRITHPLSCFLQNKKWNGFGRQRKEKK